MRTERPHLYEVASRRWLAAAVLLTIVGCGDRGAAGGDTGAAAAPASPQLARRVTILTPADGDTVGPDVRVTLGVTGVTIEAANNTHEEGKGHHHLFLDANVTPSDAPIPPATTQIIHLGTGATEHTFPGLAPGPHRIIAVVAYGDHIPMAGTMTDTVMVVVRRP